MSSRPLALVTGASSGIGLELAKLLASEQFDLIVAAEDAELKAAADELRAAGAQVQVVQTDLRTADGVEKLAAAVTGPLDALVLNAGVGQGKAFIDAPLDALLSIVDLNCRSTVHLARVLLPAMVERGEGRVLITSSIASTMPGTYQAVYNASKSFTQSFALAIREELSDSGVTVTSLMPGPTETEFFERADMLDTDVGSGEKDPADLVARQGFDAMMAGEERARGGGPNSKLQGAISRVVPDSVKAKMHAAMAKPGSGD